MVTVIDPQSLKPLNPRITLAVQGLGAICDALAGVHGDSAVISALLSVAVNRAVRAGRRQELETLLCGLPKQLDTIEALISAEREPMGTA